MLEVELEQSRAAVENVGTEVSRAKTQSTRPANRPAFGGTVPLFYQMSRVLLNHGNVPLFVRSRIFLRAQFVTLPRCPDVNANHPIERNYGNSVRFIAKIPNGTAAESPCYSVFWNAIDFCRLYTSTKISMWALPTVPLFAGKSRLFTRNVPLKTFSRLAGLKYTSHVQLSEWNANRKCQYAIFRLAQVMSGKHPALQ